MQYVGHVVTSCHGNVQVRGSHGHRRRLLVVLKMAPSAELSQDERRGLAVVFVDCFSPMFKLYHLQCRVLCVCHSESFLTSNHSSAS